FRWPGGLDLTLVNVHAVAGASQKTGTLRLHTFGSLDSARDAAMDYGKDEDVIFLGDFNTVGMASNPMAATREIVMLAASFAAHAPPLMLVSTDTPCTEYSDGNSWWLDHMVMPKSMHEANAPRLEVEGYCAQLRCIADKDASHSRAHDRLSDHCPVVLTLDDIDIDTQFAINP
ncbi:MAG TPA: hypothetical protein VFB62_03575, partial [Polyangiaceae bacterium]|nr:hypothetical protein [Polyangiaceae bacterium]